MKITRDRYPEGAEGDKAFLNALLEVEFVWAKEQREGLRYEEENFKVRMTLVGSAYQVARLPHKPWANNDEKYELMGKIACLAAVLEVKAVMVATDTRFCSLEDFALHYNLPAPGPGNNEMLLREYQRVLREHGGDLCNLPRHLWRESVNVAMKVAPAKGEAAEQELMKMASYTRGSNGRILWLPDTPFKGGRYEMRMLEDWWAIPEDDPRLVITRNILGPALEEMLATRH
jgi:hypothetical protein